MKADDQATGQVLDRLCRARASWPALSR